MDSILGIFFLITLYLAFVKPWFDTPRSLRKYQKENKRS